MIKQDYIDANCFLYGRLTTQCLNGLHILFLPHRST